MAAGKAAADELPLSQREQYGSFEWYVSMNRRNRVEGFFGNLKDRARANIRRGTIRVMGLVKTELLVAMAVASLNLRLGEKWEDTKNETSPVKKIGRPRKEGVAAYARASCWPRQAHRVHRSSVHSTVT